MKCIVSYGCSTTLDVYDLSVITIEQILEEVEYFAENNIEMNVVDYKRKEQ